MNEQLKTLAWGVLAWGLAYWLLRFLGVFSDSPWRVVVVLVPLAVVVGFLGFPLWRDRRLLLGGGFLIFFVAYCMLFAVADGTEVLSGRRQVLAGFDDATPRSFLGLTRLADWHYLFVPPAPDADDLVIVTVEPFEGKSRVDARRVLAGLVKTAADHGARAVVFDFYLSGASNVDRILCHHVQKARDGGTSVFFGSHLEERDGILIRRRLPDSLACLGEDSLSSLAGYRESDGIVRMVPTTQPGDDSVPALGVRVAQALEPGFAAGPRLVQFVAPEHGIPTLDGPLTEDRAAILEGKVVLVGSRREDDRHRTPFGLRRGVEIHAFSAVSLVSGHFIRRLDRFWSFPVVFGLCYILTLIQASGAGTRALFAGGAIVSLTLVAGAALAMRGLVWVDAVYPLVAVWVLVVLLSGGAALQRGRRAARGTETRGDPDGSEPEEGDVFDVFLAHNGADKRAVRKLAERLEARGLRPWLDVEELIPGQPWVPALEKAIESVRSAAVIVGKDGIGPWEQRELWGCLEQSVERGMPVIPLLLPGDYEAPKLPLFFGQLHWLDCRRGLTEEKLDGLEWGITLVKPNRR